MLLHGWDSWFKVRFQTFNTFTPKIAHVSETGQLTPFPLPLDMFSFIGLFLFVFFSCVSCPMLRTHQKARNSRKQHIVGFTSPDYPDVKTCFFLKKSQSFRFWMEIAKEWAISFASHLCWELLTGRSTDIVTFLHLLFQSQFQTRCATERCSRQMEKYLCVNVPN